MTYFSTTWFLKYKNTFCKINMDSVLCPSTFSTTQKTGSAYRSLLGIFILQSGFTIVKDGRHTAILSQIKIISKSMIVYTKMKKVRKCTDSG